MSQLANGNSKPAMLDDRNWRILLKAISQQRCTPFLGPEMAFGNQPVRDLIARQWAGHHAYPLEDCYNLSRVAQFIATELNEFLTKMEITDSFRAWRLHQTLQSQTDKSGLMDLYRDLQPPDLSRTDNPYRILASLPLPIFVTTTFDDFMFEALASKDVGGAHRDPRKEICRWNEAIVGDPSIFDSGFQPTVANPAVFHLYGHMDSPESLVLTEDEILDFLAAVSRDSQLIPRRIQEAFTKTSLLFLGYRLSDLDFKVLLRSLVSYLKRNVYFNSRAHVSVQLFAVGETMTPDKKHMIEEHLSKYCAKLDIQVCWATCQEFLVELRRELDKEAGKSAIQGGTNGHNS